VTNLKHASIVLNFSVKAEHVGPVIVVVILAFLCKCHFVQNAYISVAVPAQTFRSGGEVSKSEILTFSDIV